MDNEQTYNTDASERLFFLVVRAILGLVLFPIVMLLAALVVFKLLVSIGLYKNHESGALVFGSISSALVGLATSVVFVWKSPRIFRNPRIFSRLGLREPIVSCL
jgi:hypothetical protein